MNRINLTPTDTDGGAVATASPATNGKPPITYEMNEITEGPLKGFKFNSPVYNDYDATTVKLGKERILGALTSLAAARIRSKVKNDNVPEKGPNGVEEFNPKNPQHTSWLQTQLITKNPGFILFSETQASDWAPDSRELSSNQLFKQIKELFETKDPVKAAQAIELMAKMQRLAEEEAASITAAAAMKAPVATA